jgi:segregation and condensation protein A
VRLELAADWLVMAAWLAWLKSRLLVPADPAELEQGEEAAEALAERLRALQAMRTAAAWLGGRPMLGHDVFARGTPEDHTEIDRSALAVELNGLLRAYLAAIRRGTRPMPYRPRMLTLWTVQDALQRLGTMIRAAPDWVELQRFLPAHLSNPVERRAALTSTLLAGLEMARDGHIRLHQDHDFAPILVRGVEAAGEPA